MPEDGRDWQRIWTRGIAGFLVLAVVLRLIRALQNYPLWCDETMLAANLLDRDWTELAQPLDYRQVCPLGFLAIQWAAVHLLGFSEFSLRLIPLASAVASIPLFYLLARSILGRGTAGTFVAVAVFAVSEPLLRYAGEAKPYESDFLLSLVLLCLSVNWLRAPGTAKCLWLVAAAVPAALAVSLPSVFTIGAIALVGFCELLRRRTAATALAGAGFAFSAGISVAAMAWLGQYRTPPDARAYFLKFWAAAFPPFDHGLLALAKWLVRANTGPLFAVPHGADGRLAWLTPAVFGCFALGAVILLRKRRSIAALLILPILLTLAASALKRYPYGMSARVNLYLVPSILIFAAAGVNWICAGRAGGRFAQDHHRTRLCAGDSRNMAAGERSRSSLSHALGPDRTRIRAMVLGGDGGRRGGRLRADGPWVSVPAHSVGL